MLTERVLYCFLPVLAVTLGFVQCALTVDILEEALREAQTLPYFSLRTTDSSTSPRQSCNFTCAAVTREEVLFSWYTGNSQRPSENDYRLPLRSSLTLYYSVFSLHDLVDKGVVSCRIRLGRTTITLSSEVVKTLLPFHLTYRDSCRGKSRHCVGDGVYCGWRFDRYECLCQKDTYYHPEFQLCVRKKGNREPCIFERQCSPGTQWCHDNLCSCKNDFTLSKSGCVQNSTLHGMCDDHRLCPPGSVCLDNGCQCLENHYEWDGACVKRFLTDSQRKTAVLVMLLVTSVIFGATLASLGVYFYKNSYRPSTMHERSGSSWDFITGSSSSRRDAT